LLLSLFAHAHLQLDFGHPSLQLDELHIQCGLLAPESCYLLLQTAVFGFLVSVVSLHFFFDFEVFVG
jgi:hypothetical protein